MHITSASNFSKQASQAKPTNKNTSNDSVVENLRKQKEEVIKKKNALMAKTAESGQSLDSIQEQLKIYDQQIQNLDMQIAKETKAASQKMIQEMQNNQKQTDQTSSSPKTKEELDGEILTAVSKLGTSLDNVKTINSVKGKIENQAGITESEIKTDNRNRSDFIEHVSWTNPGAASLINKQGASNNKYDKLDALNMRIVELEKALGDKMNNIQQEIQDTRLKEKIQNVIKQWNSSEGKKNGEEQNDSSTDANYSKDLLVRLDEAFKKAFPAAKDFSSKFPQWVQEARDKHLKPEEKEDFLNDKLESWEKQLQEKSPDQYEAWKIATASLDISV